MIVLLGATGYIGQAFGNELRRRGRLFVPLTRKALDYSQFDILFDYVRKVKPEFLINAAGYTGRPNVDACETARADTVQGNILFPQMMARVCLLTNTPFGHVSSGCIYSGARVLINGASEVHKKLSEPRLQQLFNKQPERFYGFTEYDEPNFSFRAPPCSFYSGSKALAEEAICECGQSYIWRLRIPFDEFDHPRNYLSKIQHYSKVYNNINSLSHRGDFVRACLDLWERQAPYGIYNVTNPGAVTTRQVVEMVEKALKPRRIFQYWKNDAEFYALAARAPRSNCILDVSKLLATGIKMRSVTDALRSALAKWRPAPANIEMMSTFPEVISEADFNLAGMNQPATVPLPTSPAS
jgi:dTDP-4-dehydrorhamnose reductase